MRLEVRLRSSGHPLTPTNAELLLHSFKNTF
jgi:hypothetical protein